MPTAEIPTDPYHPKTSERQNKYKDTCKDKYVDTYNHMIGGCNSKECFKSQLHCVQQIPSMQRHLKYECNHKDTYKLQIIYGQWKYCDKVLKKVVLFCELSRRKSISATQYLFKLRRCPKRRAHCALSSSQN